MKYTIPCLASIMLLATGCSPEVPAPEAGMPAAAGSAEQPPVAAEPAPEELSEFEVLGLRAGMSESQVRAELAAERAEMTIGPELTESYAYSDGMYQQDTDPYLERITASSGDPDDGTSLVIHFSPPPGPPRVVSIVRTEMARSNPPTRSSVVNSLIFRYGTPAFQFDSDQAVIGWSQPGRPQCVWDNDEEVGAWTTAEFRQHQQSPVRRISLPDDPSRCGVSVVATIPGAPEDDDAVETFSVFLVDPGALARAVDALERWLAGLGEEAGRAR